MIAQQPTSQQRRPAKRLIDRPSPKGQNKNSCPAHHCCGIRSHHPRNIFGAHKGELHRLRLNYRYRIERPPAAQAFDSRDGGYPERLPRPSSLPYPVAGSIAGSLSVSASQTGARKEVRRSPSASYSITMRVLIDNKVGMIGEVIPAIGAAWRPITICASCLARKRR